MPQGTVQPYESDAITHFFYYSQNIARMLLVSFKGIRLLMDEGTKATTLRLPWCGRARLGLLVAARNNGWLPVARVERPGVWA